MRTRRLLTLLAVTALAVVAPPVAAGHHRYDCGFDTVPVSSGGDYAGVAYGYVAGDADDTVSVSCVIKVNGMAAASTPTASGTAAAVTHGPVAYRAGVFDDLDVCAVHSVNGVTAEACSAVFRDSLPPPAYWEVVEILLDFVLELQPIWLGPTVCATLASMAGSYGPLVINAQGDVFVAGEPQWDCPPYDIEWP